MDNVRRRLNKAVTIAAAGARNNIDGARRVLIAVALVFTGVVIFHVSPRILVTNHPERADVITVLLDEYYRDDKYYRHALNLLAANYGAHLIILADASGDPGQTEADDAARFVEATAGRWRNRVLVCPEGDDEDEYGSIDRCLGRLHAHTVLMVTPAVESRRMMMLYTRHLPQYSWHVAAVDDPHIFGRSWWSNRRWAKAYIENLQRLMYAAVER